MEDWDEVTRHDASTPPLTVKSLDGRAPRGV